MAQGALPFQYEAETAASGVTALGGLPIYLDLIKGWMSRSASMSGSPGSRAGSIFR
jgi:hypothetical protein